MQIATRLRATGGAASRTRWKDVTAGKDTSP
jgi:hypothetical protein